jgi:3-hydroxymyristoyl/3-hydroxydecanoyl-(acyl carrier protein) dehydratase
MKFVFRSGGISCFDPAVLDPAFAADCPYGPEGLLIDDITLVDTERGRVVARFPTSDDLPFVRAQRTHPVRHPRHVAAGVMIHLTGIMGYAHAYFIEGLRHADGWVGYGVRIRQARFLKLAHTNSPMELMIEGPPTRRLGNKRFGHYHFEFRQDGDLIYDGAHSAMWLRPEAEGNEPAAESKAPG